jgi:MFS family permease
MTGNVSSGRAAADGESALRYRGWRVVSACYVAAVFCWGYGLYGHGVYLAELNRLHGWPTSLIAGATTGFYLVTAAMVVFISDALTRLGPKRVMLIGGSCFAIAVALLAVITELWQLYVAYLVMSVGAATMHVGSISNVVGMWFERQRGLAISLALNGASSGGILITPALVLAIAHFGFANTMLASAALFVVVLLPIVAIWIDRPASHNVVAKQETLANSAPAMTRRDALRNIAFWSVAAPTAMALTAQVGFLVHQIAFMEPLLGRAHVGLSVATLTVAAITGRFVLGAYAARVDIRRVAFWSLLSQAVALVAMTLTANPAALFISCAVFGLSAGNLLTFPALIIQREFEAKAFGMLVGLSWAITQFTYAFGPGALGIIRDATGSYTAPLVLCIALDVVAAVLIVRRPRR